jgi:predicted phage tail protein
MLREIRVYGQLAKFLGRRTFKAAVSTAAEAVRFLLANFPQLDKHMADQHYRVCIGDYGLSMKELHDPSGKQTIKIIPVIGGNSGNAVGDILIGVALVAGTLLIPGAAAWLGPTVSTLFVSTGVALALGGTAQLLTPTESLTPIGVDLTAGTDTGTEGTVLDPQESYSFSGIQNTSRPGVPLPICYGEMIVGSIVISTGTDTIQEAV